MEWRLEKARFPWREAISPSLFFLLGCAVWFPDSQKALGLTQPEGQLIATLSFLVVLSDLVTVIQRLRMGCATIVFERLQAFAPEALEPQSWSAQFAPVRWKWAIKMYFWIGIIIAFSGPGDWRWGVMVMAGVMAVMLWSSRRYPNGEEYLRIDERGIRLMQLWTIKELRWSEIDSLEVSIYPGWKNRSVRSRVRVRDNLGTAHRLLVVFESRRELLRLTQLAGQLFLAKYVVQYGGKENIDLAEALKLPDSSVWAQPKQFES